MYETIRKNSLKRIQAILSKAVLITRYSYDDMDGGSNTQVTPERVMESAKAFDRVTLDERGCMHIKICGSSHYNAYPNIDAARKALTPEAFAKYFPAEGTAALHKSLETSIERAKVREANAIDGIAAAREARLIERLQAQRWNRRPDFFGNVPANDD